MEKNSKPNPNAKRKDPRFFIPKEFFNQLNEYSNGGYILIAMDELGDPVIYTKYDNKTVKLGLQSHAEKFFTRKNRVEEPYTLVNDSEEGVDEEIGTIPMEYPAEDGDEDGEDDSDKQFH